MAAVVLRTRFSILKSAIIPSLSVRMASIVASPVSSTSGVEASSMPRVSPLYRASAATRRCASLVKSFSTRNCAPSVYTAMRSSGRICDRYCRNCARAYTWSRLSVLMPSSRITVAAVGAWLRNSMRLVKVGTFATGPGAAASCAAFAGRLVFTAKNATGCSLPLSNTVKSSLVSPLTGPFRSRTMTLISTSRVVTRITPVPGVCAAKASESRKPGIPRVSIQWLDVAQTPTVTRAAVGQTIAFCGLSQRPCGSQSFMNHCASLRSTFPSAQVCPPSCLLRQNQYFVQRSLAVSFQVQRHILESQRLEDRREPLRHVDGERPLHLFARDLNPHHIAVIAHAELPEAQLLDAFLRSEE